MVPVPPNVPLITTGCPTYKVPGEAAHWKVPAVPVMTTLDSTVVLVVPVTVTVWPTRRGAPAASQTNVPAALVEYTPLRAVAVVDPVTDTVWSTTNAVAPL
jgi:hypothetical protein